MIYIVLFQIVNITKINDIVNLNEINKSVVNIFTDKATNYCQVDHCPFVKITEFC